MHCQFSNQCSKYALQKVSSAEALGMRKRKAWTIYYTSSIQLIIVLRFWWQLGNRTRFFEAPCLPHGSYAVCPIQHLYEQIKRKQKTSPPHQNTIPTTFSHTTNPCILCKNLHLPLPSLLPGVQTGPDQPQT